MGCSKSLAHVLFKRTGSLALCAVCSVCCKSVYNKEAKKKKKMWSSLALTLTLILNPKPKPYPEPNPNPNPPQSSSTYNPICGVHDNGSPLCTSLVLAGEVAARRISVERALK